MFGVYGLVVVSNIMFDFSGIGDVFVEELECVVFVGCMLDGWEMVG